MSSALARVLPQEPQFPWSALASFTGHGRLGSSRALGRPSSFWKSEGLTEMRQTWGALCHGLNCVPQTHS